MQLSCNLIIFTQDELIFNQKRKKNIFEILTSLDSLLQNATLLQNGLYGKFQIVINFSTRFVINVTICLENDKIVDSL